MIKIGGLLSLSLLSLLLLLLLLPLGTHSSASKKGSSDPDRNILGIAIDNNLTDLVLSLMVTDLVDVLQGPGPFTVFAPTDEAFDALGPSVLQGLLEEEVPILRELLLYHVLEGAVDLMVGDVTTVQGETISITRYGRGYVLNGKVNLLQKNVLATNGVVHIVDGVLIPPSFRPATEPAPNTKTSKMKGAKKGSKSKSKSKSTSKTNKSSKMMKLMGGKMMDYYNGGE